MEPIGILSMCQLTLYLERFYSCMCNNSAYHAISICSSYGITICKLSFWKERCCIEIIAIQQHFCRGYYVFISLKIEVTIMRKVLILYLSCNYYQRLHFHSIAFGGVDCLYISPNLQELGAFRLGSRQK